MQPALCHRLLSHTNLSHSTLPHDRTLHNATNPFSHTRTHTCTYSQTHIRPHSLTVPLCRLQTHTRTLTFLHTRTHRTTHTQFSWFLRNRAPQTTSCHLTYLNCKVHPHAFTAIRMLSLSSTHAQRHAPPHPSTLNHNSSNLPRHSRPY